MIIYSMSDKQKPSRRSLSLPPISPAAEGPLYEQIVRHLQREIAEDRLTPHQALPSFRQLARELMVSLITVKRAYEELEHQGLIYRRQGLGTFIADQSKDRVRESKRHQVEKLLAEAAREAAEAGFGQKEWKTCTEKIWKAKKKESRS